MPPKKLTVQQKGLRKDILKSAGVQKRRVPKGKRLIYEKANLIPDGSWDKFGGRIHPDGHRHLTARGARSLPFESQPTIPAGNNYYPKGGTVITARVGPRVYEYQQQIGTRPVSVPRYRRPHYDGKNKTGGR